MAEAEAYTVKGTQDGVSCLHLGQGPAHEADIRGLSGDERREIGGTLDAARKRMALHPRGGVDRVPHQGVLVVLRPHHAASAQPQAVFG